MDCLLLRRRSDDSIGRLVLAACIILVLVLVPSAEAAAASPDGWAIQTSGTELTLYGVWGTAPDDVFAVGENGTILHYDGAAWDFMSSNTTDCLYAVWGSSSSDVFVVGLNGVINHYDGHSWGSMSSGVTKHLQGVWGTDNQNVFAVGYSGTIVHYDGSSWSPMTSNTSTHLKCVWGTSSSDVFAAGNGGEVVHYDGVDWSKILDDGHPNFMGIWGTASDNVFAAGVGGMVLRYDGASWNEMATGVGDDLTGVWGTSSADVFIVGLDGTILHYDGSAWSEMDGGVTGSLRSIYGFSSVDVLAVGYNGTILHYRELPPELGAVSPDQGNQGQTLDVTITGTNLDTATSVSFGSGVSVNSYQADSPSQLSVNITVDGAASAGPRNVSVSNPYGTDVLNGAFAVPPASVSSVSPPTGKQGQTLDVALIGTNLGRTTSVAFGDGIAVNSFTVDNPDRVSASITISDSALIGARDVIVDTEDGNPVLTNGFSVTVHDPAIVGVSPSSGNQGQSLDVAITGVNLDGATGVSFGEGITVNSFAEQSAEGVIASITIGDAATLGPRDVAVITVDGTADLPNAFSITAEPPTIAEISPLSGKIGQTLSLSITGANLGSTRIVSLGTGIVVESFVSAPDQITVSVVISGDASLGPRDVSVTTDGGTATLPGGFIVYRLPPGVIGINPTYGVMGQTLDVIISGVNFFGTTSVDFGLGINVNGFTVDSDLQITVNITILSGAQSGLRAVRITTATGSVDFPNGFDLRVADASGESSHSQYTPAQSTDLSWIPLLVGGLVVVMLTALLFVVKKKRENAKESSTAP